MELLKEMQELLKFDEIMSLNDLSLRVLAYGMENYPKDTAGYAALKTHITKYVEEVVEEDYKNRNLFEKQLLLWLMEGGSEKAITFIMSLHTDRGVYFNKKGVYREYLHQSVMYNFDRYVSSNGRQKVIKIVDKIFDEING